MEHLPELKSLKLVQTLNQSFKFRVFIGHLLQQMESELKYNRQKTGRARKEETTESVNKSGLQ